LIALIKQCSSNPSRSRIVRFAARGLLREGGAQRRAARAAPDLAVR
jgi:hypothetical protein